MHFTRNRPPNETLLLNQLVGWGSMAVVVAGIAAAAAALAGGWKEQSRETLLLAVLGLVLNVGIVLVTLWMLYVIRQARG
jgi:anti-sigma-K factor RskA